MQPLQSIAQQWLNPHYSLRQQAITSAAAEFHLSQESFSQALNWIFQQWTEENIQRGIAKKNALFSAKEITYVVHVLAGNTPAVIAQGFFQGALLEKPQYLKIPSQQKVFAQLLYQSFMEQAPELAKLFELSVQREGMEQHVKQANVLIAYGSDETMAALKSHARKETRVITHGHAQSAAILFKEANYLDSLEKLAEDMLSYDQRGCLSPRVVFVENAGQWNAVECAQQFAKTVLPQVAKKWPRGKLFPGEAEEILHQRILCGFRGQVHPGEDWTVCYEENLHWPEKALPRFLLFEPFETTEQLIGFLKPYALIGLGYAGSKQKITAFQEVAEHLCPVGEMQKQLLLF